MSGPRSSEEWAAFYADVRPTYQTFTERLEDLVETLLDDEELRYWYVYSWSLSVANFEEAIDRARREGKLVHDPFVELDDIAGVYVVAYTLGEATEIAEFVEREFDLDSDASVSFAEARRESDRREDADEPIDYRRAHYAVTLDERRSELTEWKPFAGLRAQIDVATIMQYVWGVLEANQYPYHWARSYPPPLQEVRARIASLLADVDRALDDHGRKVEELAGGYAAELADGRLALELNAWSLAAYLRASEPLAELVRIAEKAGMRHDDDPHTFSDWSLEQRLLWLLERYSLRTLADVDTFFRGALERGPKILADIAHLSKERGYVPWATIESIAAWLLLVLHRADGETVVLAGFYDELRHALDTLIGNPIEAEPES
jgi:ppGpp synthetase/RelA/SpoT-type nucleotidyltranferase